jgi:hypothetical protein
VLVAIALTVGLVVAELLVAHDRLLHGGLYQDDWPITWIRRFMGFGGLLQNLTDADHLRPVAGLYFTLTDSLSTSITGEAQTLVSFALHLSVGVGIYLLLRRIGLLLVLAVALTGLVLLFPWSDSTWLWWAASVGNVALLLALLACYLELRSTEVDGRRALLLELGAGGLFAISVLTYQLAAVACLLVALWGVQRDRRRAIRRLVINAVLVALAVLLPLAITGSRGVLSPQSAPASAWIGNAMKLGDSAASLLSSATMPFGAPHRNVVLPILTLLLLVVLLHSRGERDAEIRRWLGWAAAGVALTVCAYLVYVTTPRGAYDPLLPGTGNRVNILAGIGMVLFLFSLALAAGAALNQHIRRPVAGEALAAALVAFLAIGYFVHARDDARAWARSAHQERADIKQIAALGRLPAGSTDFVSGLNTTSITGVDVFHLPGELKSAMGLYWQDPTLFAYPVISGASIICAADAVLANPTVPSIADSAPYDHTYFTNLHTRERVQITSPRQCKTQLHGLLAGAGT